MVRSKLCLLGLVSILVIVSWSIKNGSTSQSNAAEGRPPQAPPSDTFADEISKLKDRAPDQAHAMVSVAYHYNNLWFAAQAKNWPLAEFYLNETRSHLRWAVRIIPVRKVKAEREIKLQDILQAVENTLVKELQTSIQTQDQPSFTRAYKTMLESGCYSCHKAVDKPYLALKLPDQPAEPMVDFNPRPLEVQPSDESKSK